MSTLDNYTRLEKLGEGTFGTVTKCILNEKRLSNGYRHNKGNYQPHQQKRGRLVALKKIIIHDLKEGFPITALREVTILKQLNHKNILPLLDIVHEKNPKLSLNQEHSDFFLVSPYMKSDLSGLLNNPDIQFSEAVVKCFLKQLLEGLNYLHHKKYYHRDIKTANLLVDQNGVLKIADFGLARKYYGHAPKAYGGPSEMKAKYTGLVVTRWYRAPELLLGEKYYTTAIDLWGVGCIFAELFETKPILMGSSDLDQLNRIYRLIGEPTLENYPRFKELPNPLGAPVVHYTPTLTEKYSKYFETLDSKHHGMDLLGHLLHLNPQTRYNAEQALNHKYFKTAPFPLEPYELPKFSESHEMDNKRFKQEKERRAKLQEQQKMQEQRGGPGRRDFPLNLTKGYASNRGYPMSPATSLPHRVKLNGPLNGSYRIRDNYTPDYDGDRPVRREAVSLLPKRPQNGSSWSRASSSAAVEARPAAGDQRKPPWETAAGTAKPAPAPAPWESAKDNLSFANILATKNKPLEKESERKGNLISPTVRHHTSSPKVDQKNTAGVIPKTPFTRGKTVSPEKEASALLSKPSPVASFLSSSKTITKQTIPTSVSSKKLLANKLNAKGDELISISKDRQRSDMKTLLARHVDSINKTLSHNTVELKSKPTGVSTTKVSQIRPNIGATDLAIPRTKRSNLSAGNTSTTASANTSLNGAKSERLSPNRERNRGLTEYEFSPLSEIEFNDEEEYVSFKRGAASEVQIKRKGRPEQNGLLQKKAKL